jgi:lipopolysaccharide O-acetyltransferase
VRGKKHIVFGRRLTTGFDCRLDAFSKTGKSCLMIGEDVQINDYVHIGAIERVEIGNRVLIASKVFITDHNHGYYGDKGEQSSPLEPPVKRKLSSAPVKIEDDVWVGEFVAVLSGVTIGKGAVIGAMSVVTKNIPSYSIAVGSSEKVIKLFNFQLNRWIRV